jgi:putative ABC transport system permease protein
MVEKTRDLKVIVTDRWQAFSQLPFAYAEPLARGAADPTRTGDLVPPDSMTWQFYMGTLDAGKETRDSQVMFIALEPRKLLTMMDEIFADLSPDHGQSNAREEYRRLLTQVVSTMEHNKRAVILGRDRLRAINKRVGDRFTVTGTLYHGIDLECEVIGVFPEGRYNDSAVMNRDYLNDALTVYPRTHGGLSHPLADKSLNLVWLLVPSQEAFGRVANQIEGSGLFRTPPVRCQTLASGIATRLDSFRDLIWGMRWLLAPAVLVTMALVICNAISISVRERRTEVAVMKVLGFRPGQILMLVVGEAITVGAVGGMLSAGLSYLTINEVLARVNPIPLYVPGVALWWGPALGALTALAGSLLPAWSATAVKVSEVFSRVG